MLARLRRHAGAMGFISHATLAGRDNLLLRSIPLHFAGLSAARQAAGVAGPPYRKPSRKTGPKPGTKSSTPRTITWSRERVLDELRRIGRAGRSTALRDLMAAGRTTLVRAASVFAGGLRNARRLAGVEAPRRRGSKKHTWTREMIVPAIRARHRARKSLAASRVPQNLYGASRRHYGSWRVALAAADIDPSTVRAGIKYTKQVIIERLRRAARSGSDLLSTSLAKVVDLKAVRREFGRLELAIRAAGLIEVLQRRRHGGRKWDGARVIEVLRERAARGVHTFTPGLRRAVQVYLGGAREARIAAGVPDPASIRRAFRARDRTPTQDFPRLGLAPLQIASPGIVTAMQPQRNRGGIVRRFCS